MKILFSLFFLFMLSCSSLSEKECQVMNWPSRGYSDALHGYTIVEIENYKKDCSEFNLSALSSIFSNPDRPFTEQHLRCLNQGYRLDQLIHLSGCLIN